MRCLTWLWRVLNDLIDFWVVDDELLFTSDPLREDR